MKTLTMTVRGMSCGGCSNRIETNIGEDDDVESVEASHRDDRVVINYGTDVDESEFADRIAAAIEDLGFDPEPEAESLD